MTIKTVKQMAEEVMDKMCLNGKVTEVHAKEIIEAVEQAITSSLLELAGSLERKPVCGKATCDCDQRNAGWNERNTAIQSKLQEMGITPKT